MFTNLCRRLLRPTIESELLRARTQKQLDLAQGANALLQILLRQRWSEGRMRSQFDDVQFRAYSQNGEDGILLYIFALIGTTNKQCVEICAGDGIECNTANLIITHGWSGLLVDGSMENIERARRFYSECRDTLVWPPQVVRAWVTVENVNQLVAEHGFRGEIDLLSLDLDGIDYWVWKALDEVQPRVVVLEYNDLWGPDKAVTIPYRWNFRATFPGGVADYVGASLNAFVKLGKCKGYRLVGCERLGFNAFFVRTGIGEELLPEIEPRECFQHPKVRHGIEKRLPNVLNREWVSV